MSTYTACDHFRHHPVGDSEQWQEAWLTSWYDPVTRSGGERHGVVRVDNRVEMAEDGHTPLAARLRVWTDTGHGYEFIGETEVSSVSTHDGGHFATETHGVWRCGGRLGSGHLAVRERGAPSAEHRAWLTAHDHG